MVRRSVARNWAESGAEIDIPAATSTAVSTVADALEAAQRIGYPVILRSAYSLGGLGSGFAENPDELRDLSAKSLSLSPQVLIERSMKVRSVNRAKTDWPGLEGARVRGRP